MLTRVKCSGCAFHELLAETYDTSDDKQFGEDDVVFVVLLNAVPLNAVLWNVLLVVGWLSSVVLFIAVTVLIVSMLLVQELLACNAVLLPKCAMLAAAGVDAGVEDAVVNAIVAEVFDPT